LIDGSLSLERPCRVLVKCIIGLLFLSLTVEALQGKRCQDSLLSGGGRSVRAKISGGRDRPRGIFFGFYKTRHSDILLSDSAKLHRATCRRFDTIPACDGQTNGQTDRKTDGIAVASTALAKRRAVKITRVVYYPVHGYPRQTKT